jgi:rubrerythrin
MNMADDFDWMFKWSYDIRDILATERDALVDDLDSGDEDTRQKAQEGLDEILAWQGPPPQPMSREERRQRFEEALKTTVPSNALRRSMALSASRSTGREPGRPRTKGQDAVRALTLRRRTEKTWREIATDIKERCEHFCPECGDTIRHSARFGKKPRCPVCKSVIRPSGKRQQVCDRCVDAARDLVERLEKFMRAKGLYLTLPRRQVLDKLSPEEQEQL